MELWSMLGGSLDGKGVWGRMDTCTSMAESLYCSPETTTTLFISYTPTQSKTFEEKRNGATTSPQEKNRVSCKEGMNVAVCSYGRDQREAKNFLMLLLVRALIPS